MRPIAALVITITLAATGPASGQRLQPAQHARAGWQAIDAGDAQKAQVHFAEALRGAPTEPTVLLGAGLAAHLLGQADHARRSLVDALKYQPSLTAASLLLGEVLYRANDIQGAIHTYEQALVHAPEHAMLSKRLAEWHKEAALHDRFAQKLGDHFTVLFEGPAEAALAAKAVEILEAAYWRIGSVLYTYPPDVVTVVLYTREQFRDITQSPDWAGGAFDGRIRVPVRGALQNLAAFERVLTHDGDVGGHDHALACREPVSLHDHGRAMRADVVAKLGGVTLPRVAPLWTSVALRPASSAPCLWCTAGTLPRQRGVSPRPHPALHRSASAMIRKVLVANRAAQQPCHAFGELVRPLQTEPLP